MSRPNSYQNSTTDKILYLSFGSGVDGTDLSGTIKISVLDANGNTLAGRHLVHVWVSTTEYGAVDAQSSLGLDSTDSSVVVDTITAAGDVLIQTDTDGEIDSVYIEVAGADTIYVMAQIGGTIYTGSVAITGP